MAQAALFYPYYSSFPGDCNGRRLGIQADAAGSFRVRANHRSPQTGNAVRKLSHAAAGFTENPDADTLRLLYPVRAGDLFHHKKGPAEKSLRSPFLSLFLAQRIRRNTNCSSFVSQWHTAPYFRQKYRMDWVPRPCPSFGETGKPSSSNRTAVQNGLTISSMRSG